MPFLPPNQQPKALKAMYIIMCTQKYGRLPEKLHLIELAAYANQTILFNMNCNNNNKVEIVLD